jgi:hypothetical protein
MRATNYYEIEVGEYKEPVYTPPYVEKLHRIEIPRMMRERHDPKTFTFLENNLITLNNDGEDPNYELPESLRPPYLRAEIKEITENGMAYINFSEPILMHLDSYVPDTNISQHSLTEFNENLQDYSMNPLFEEYFPDLLKSR